MKEYLSYGCVKHNNKIIFYNKEFGYVSIDEENGLTESLDTDSCAANFAIMEIGDGIYAFSNGSAKLEQICGNKIINLPEVASSMYATDYITFGEFWGLLFGNKVFICNDRKGGIETIHFEKIFGQEAQYVGKNERCLYFWTIEKELIVYDAVLGREERRIKVGMELNIINVCKEEKIFILAENGVFNISEDNVLIPIVTCEVDFKQYGRIHILDNKLVLLPWTITNNAQIIILDLENGFISEYNDYPADFILSSELESHPYVRYCIKDQSIYYPTRSSNYILEINKEKGIKWIKADYANEHFESRMINKMMKTHKVMREIDEKSLERFIYQLKGKVWNN